MPDATQPPDDDRDALAGELALGLLTGEERAAALRLTLSDPAFAVAVENWNRRLAPMLDGIAPVAPPADAWPRIVAQVKGGVSRTALRWWRTATIAATGIAAALAMVVAFRPPATVPVMTPVAAPQIVLLAQIPDAQGQPVASLHVDQATGQLRVRTDRLPDGAKVPELWVIGADKTPHSLGLVARNAIGDYVLAPGITARLVDGATIAVTLEPQSNTPHAAPSGAILGTARLTSLGRIA